MLVAKIRARRAPKESCRRCLSFIVTIIIVNSSKKLAIKPHLVEQSSICIGMSKCIDCPSNFRHEIKLFLQKLMTCHENVDKILKLGSSLIGSRNTTIDDFKLSRFDKVLGLILFFQRLVVIPLLKESHLCKSKLSTLVLSQLINSGI